MSLKKVAEVKNNDKGFKIFDIAVYGIIAVLIAVMFIAVFATKDTSPLKGICVYVNNIAVYEYDFTDNTEDYNGKILATDGSVKVEEGDILKITISAYGGYNVILLDKGGSVSVSEADCGKRDCTYMPAITNNSGIIYCSPHRLKIVPLQFTDDGNITM